MKNGTHWTRDYTYEDDPEDNNQLTKTTIGGSNYAMTYNARGAMISMAHLPTIVRDFNDQMRQVTISDDDGYYAYDAGGQRVRKSIEKGANVEETFYLGGWELFRKHVGASLDQEYETLHVMDDQSRVCIIETLTKDGGSVLSPPTTVWRYQLANHLGSALLELDEQARIISYEEYFPFGATSWHASDNTITAIKKRYRYTGKERDEWTGLSYHGARYYAPWLGRWCAADPIGIGDGVNRYAYVGNRPIGSRDSTGLSSDDGSEVSQFEGKVGGVETVSVVDSKLDVVKRWGAEKIFDFNTAVKRAGASLGNTINSALDDPVGAAGSTVGFLSGHSANKAWAEEAAAVDARYPAGFDGRVNAAIETATDTLMPLLEGAGNTLAEGFMFKTNLERLGTMMMHPGTTPGALEAQLDATFSSGVAAAAINAVWATGGLPKGAVATEAAAVGQGGGTTLTVPLLKRELRRVGTPEAYATDAWLSRYGDEFLTIKSVGPSGQGGGTGFRSGRIKLYESGAGSVSEGAGHLAHEVRHWMQKFNSPNHIGGAPFSRVNYSWAHEVDAYRFGLGVHKSDFFAHRTFDEAMAITRQHRVYRGLK